MKKVGLVYDDIYAKHDTAGYYSHPECIDRVLRTIDLLKKHQIYGKDHKEEFVPIQPRSATFDEIQWVHDRNLIEKIEYSVSQSTDSRRSYMDGDTPVSPQSLNAALKAAGGNFEAIDAVLEGKVDRAFVLCRPPGHHANKGFSRGFCLFNNVALAAHYLIRKKNIKRVGIYDFDVHAGNGTEDLLWNGIPGGEVLFISSHQDPRSFYPGECFAEDIGEGSQKGKIANITFRADSGDKCMKSALNEVILPMFREFKPEVILFSAGFDGHHSDPIGGLGFTDQGFGNIIKAFEPIAEEYAHGRMIATLEGGYNLDSLARSIANVVSAMSGGSMVENDDEFSDSEDNGEYTTGVLLPELKDILSPYWKCFSK